MSSGDGTRRSPPEGAPPGAPIPGKVAMLADRIRAVAAVASVVVDRGDGAPRTEPLTASEEQMLVVRRLAQRLGDALGAGRATAGLLQGAHCSALLLAGDECHLTILTKPGTRADAVQAEIHALLTSSRT